MKLLWLINNPLPLIAKKLEMPRVVTNGWLIQFTEYFMNAPEYDFMIVFPQAQKKEIIKGTFKSLKYWGFYEPKIPILNYSKEIERDMTYILKETKPDLIHIWGTEYCHSASMVKACHEADKMVISMQGIISSLAKYYRADLPLRVYIGYTLRDFLRQDNIYQQKRKFIKRGEMEIFALKRSKNVIGRTEWDEAVLRSINPELRYYKCYEILRKSFYKHTWDLEKCNKYSIFVSQASYPIKGLHYLIKIMPQIISEFPSTKLMVAGKKIGNRFTFRERLKLSAYDKYLMKLIKQLKLEQHVDFLGPLEEKDMCETYLSAHVFVLPSVLENSPNSLGEAMILGVPSVVADVGGVKDFINHGQDGFVYPHNEPEMISYYIRKIFNDKELSLKISASGKNRARRIFDVNKNIKVLESIYDKIYEENAECIHQ